MAVLKEKYWKYVPGDFEAELQELSIKTSTELVNIP